MTVSVLIIAFKGNFDLNDTKFSAQVSILFYLNLLFDSFVTSTFATLAAGVTSQTEKYSCHMTYTSPELIL